MIPGFFILPVVLIMLWVLWYVICSEYASKKEVREDFFLSDRFFSSLIVQASFWLVLMLFLGLREIPHENRQSLIILVSLFAPFLNWWQKKTLGMKS